MLLGLDEKKLSSKKWKVKVRPFSGAKIEDLHHYCLPLLKKNPRHIIIHVGTNDIKESLDANKALDNILQLKNFLEKKLPNARVVISNIITRTDDKRAQESTMVFNKHLDELKLKTINNNNIQALDLGKKGLHLSQKGKAKFASNLKKVISNFKVEN